MSENKVINNTKTLNRIRTSADNTLEPKNNLVNTESKKFEISTNATILLMYSVILCRYYYFTSGYFDLQFLIYTGILLFLTWVNYNKNNVTAETIDISKFLAHTLFISLTLSIISSLLSVAYNIMFYFGFVNTIIVSKIILMFSMSGLIKLFGDEIYNYLSSFNLGNKILDGINYYYNTYIVSKNISNQLMQSIKYFLTNYVWVFIKFLYYKFMKIDKELRENSRSANVDKQFTVKCNETKNYFFNEFVKSYISNKVNTSLNKDTFPLARFEDELLKNSVPIHYKNNLHNSNLDMSFLTKTEVNNNLNDLDDLDDELDLSNVPTVTEENLFTHESEEKKTNNSNTDNSNMVNSNMVNATTSNSVEKNKSTPNEKKEALRKKVAEMKAARMGGARTMGSQQIQQMQQAQQAQQMQQDLKEMMKMPGMDQMMNIMMQGDNLEKMMKMAGQNNTNLPKLSQTEMKEMKEMLKQIS